MTAPLKYIRKHPEGFWLSFDDKDQLMSELAFTPEQRLADFDDNLSEKIDDAIHHHDNELLLDNAVASDEKPYWLREADINAPAIKAKQKQPKAKAVKDKNPQLLHLKLNLVALASAIGLTMALPPSQRAKFDHHTTEHLTGNEADIARDNAAIRLVADTTLNSVLSVFDDYYNRPGQSVLIQQVKDKTKALAALDQSIANAAGSNRQALQIKRAKAAAELAALPQVQHNDMAVVSSGLMIAALMVPQADFKGPMKRQGPAERFGILNTIALPESQYRSNVLANNYNGPDTARGALQIQMPELMVMMMRHHDRLISPSGHDPFEAYIKATKAIADKYAKQNLGKVIKSKGIDVARQAIAARSDWARDAWEGADEKDKVIMRNALVDQTPVTIFGIRSNVGSVLSGFTAQYLSDEACNMPQDLINKYGIASLIYAKHNQGTNTYRLMIRDIAELRDPSLFQRRMGAEVAAARKAAMPVINEITNQTIIAHGATTRIGRQNLIIRQQANLLRQQARRMKAQRNGNARANALIARANAVAKKANAAIAKDREILRAANARLAAARRKDAEGKLTATLNLKLQRLRQGVTGQWQRDIASTAPTNKGLYFKDGKLVSPEAFLANVRDKYGVVTQPSLAMGRAFAPHYKPEGGVRQIAGMPIPQFRRDGRRLSLMVAPLALEASLKAQAARRPTVRVSYNNAPNPAR